MTLTVEHVNSSTDTEEVLVFCDDAGLNLLLEQLQILKRHKGHVHLMTPAWAGKELTENKQDPDSKLINHLRITLIPETRL